MGDLRNRFFAVAVALVLVATACSDPEGPTDETTGTSQTPTAAAASAEPTEPPNPPPTPEPSADAVVTPEESTVTAEEPTAAPTATTEPSATAAPEDLPTGPPPGGEPTVPPTEPTAVPAATAAPATPVPATPIPATPVPTPSTEATPAPTAAPTATVPAGPALTIGDRALKETDMSRGWLALGDNPSYEPPQTGEPSDCDPYNQADSVQDFFEYETSLASEDGTGFVTQHLGFTDDPAGTDALIAAGRNIVSQCDLINEPTGQSQAVDFPVPANLSNTSAAFRQARPDGDTVLIYVREGNYVARLRVDLLSESTTTDAEIVEWATNMVGRLSA